MIHFISEIAALAIHDDLIATHGGAKGIRDVGLLQSALEMPKSSFGGHDMHPTLFDKAAAYLYHIAKNHPFIDGNKRTAAKFEELVVSTATGAISKKEIAQFLLDSLR